jgi:hypothetical protein
MKKPKAATVARQLAIRFSKFPDGRVVYGPVWCEQLEKAIDSALKRAAREAAWDGFVNGRGREATGFEGWTKLMTRKYGKRPARRTRCDPKT